MVSKQALIYSIVGLIIFSTIAAFVSFREQAVQSGRVWEETRRSMARSYNIIRGLRHEVSQTLQPDFSQMNEHMDIVLEKSNTLTALLGEGERAYAKLRPNPQAVESVHETTKELNRTIPLFQSQFLETARTYKALVNSVDQTLNSLGNSTVTDQERALSELRRKVVALGNLSQQQLFDESNESEILAVQNFVSINPGLGNGLENQVAAFLRHLQALRDVTNSIDNIELRLSAEGTILFTAVNDARVAAQSRAIPIFVLVVIQLVTLATIFIFKSHRLKEKLVYHNEELEGLVQVRTQSLEIALENLKESAEQQKIIEEELRIAHRLEAIGQLAAGIAHEINTPSQFVNDNLQFILEAHTDLAKVRDAYAKAVKEIVASYNAEGVLEKLQDLEDEIDLEFLQDEVPSALKNSLEGMERISKIVKSMKDFSHPGSEGVESIDINQAIETTLSVARNEWKYVANVEKDFAEDLPKVPVVATELNQVLLNIIVNAAHAIVQKNTDTGSDELGNLRITTEYDDKYVGLRIRDDGCGIPQENIDRVFDPFFTTKEVGKGTGQGLSIARKIIVDTHDGLMEVKSELGQFTEFHIKLPINQEKSESLDPVVAAENQSNIETEQA